MSQFEEHGDTGRRRLFLNVMAGWWAHLVTVVVGFVMPRVIYDSVGQEVLGLWDLGWSLVTYIAYSGLGLASAVTHYVARHRAEGSETAVREVTATAWYCQGVLALASGVLFMAAFGTLNLWLPNLDDVPVAELWWMAILLGLTIAVGIMGNTAQAVLAGCHHGARNEYLTVASDLTLAASMVIVLLLGGGIVGLAAVTFATRLVFETVRLVAAHLACPGMSWRRLDVTLVRARYILEHGVKTSTGIFQELLVHQLARLVLVASAGPVALACYSRYATLIRQIARSVERVTQVLPPIASGWFELGREQDIQRLNRRASNAAVMAMLPMVLVFGVLGDDLVALWMGSEFVVPGLSWVLAAMAFVHSDRPVATQILSGLNAHGRISLFCLVASLTVFGLMLIMLYPVDPLSAGILVAVTMMLGVSLPHVILTCRRLGENVMEHILGIYLKPMISNLFFFILLILARDLLHAGEHGPAALTAGVGGASVLVFYWLFAFDDELRDKVRRRVFRAVA